MTASLNDQQLAAAQHVGGHALVLAGAGSGKTTTLAHRVAWLLDEGVEPWRVCAVTFTNRAAEELVDRVGRLAGDRASEVWAMTFHSLCAKMLRIDGGAIGLPARWTVADREDSLSILKQVLRTDARDDAPSDVLRRISKHKNAGQRVEQIDDYDLKPVWRAYARGLEVAGQLDFDDLLLAATGLLEGEVGDKWRARFRHVLVDEYQDTNPVQEMLLKRLVGEGSTLWAVGDELQVLYRFRLAEVGRILSFDRRWPPSTTYPIEHNYRSQARILEAANAVVERSGERTNKRLQATREPGSAVRLLGCVDGRSEASQIARYLSDRLRRVSPSSCAILYRQHDLSRAIEHELLKRGIPYRVLGGTSFYTRSEVKHARALLGLLYNPRDTVAASRILLWQTGIGQTTVDRLRTWSEAQTVPIAEAMYAADRLPGVSRRASEPAMHIARAIADVRQGDGSLLDVYRRLRDAAGLLEWARASKERAEERVANLGEFENVLAEYAGAWETAIEEFMETSALEEGDRRDEHGEGITLTTIHAAKGLEWEHVWVAGLEQELYVRDPTDEEDARRLVHVAITRGKDEVHLSYARERFRWGTVTPMHPLWLLGELPPGVERQEAGGRPKGGAGRVTSGLPRDERARALDWLGSGPVADETASAVSYPPGAAVHHAKLGRGVVIADAGERVTVSFRGQAKTLLKAYASLRRE